MNLLRQYTYQHQLPDPTIHILSVPVCSSFFFSFNVLEFQKILTFLVSLKSRNSFIYAIGFMRRTLVLPVFLLRFGSQYRSLSAGK